MKVLDAILAIANNQLLLDHLGTLTPSYEPESSTLPVQLLTQYHLSRGSLMYAFQETRLQDHILCYRISQKQSVLAIT